MAKWRKKTLDEISQRIVQMGLLTCPICGSEQLKVHRSPTVVMTGGVLHEQDHPNYDPETNIEFLVNVECDSCSYVMLFNLERMISPDEPSLVIGPEPEDET